MAQARVTCFRGARIAILDIYYFTPDHRHLLDQRTLDRVDTERMYATYDRWPHIAREAYESGIHGHGQSGGTAPIAYDDAITHMVFAGMGGSGAIGDLFAAILSNTAMHVTVTKGYALPKTVNDSTLVVTTSVSGDTSETRTVLDSARKTGANVVAVSSGGMIEGFCKNNGLKHIRVDQNHSPRASFAGVAFAMLGAFEEILPLHRRDVSEAIARLEDMHAKISSQNLNCSDNVAQNTAERLGPIPLIYYPFGLQAAAIRFKNVLQENAKTHAIIEDVVEACHNGIVAWERPSDVSPVIITGSDDHPKTRERWDILKEYFASRDIHHTEMRSGEGGILAKIMGLVYWSDYASIYRAVINGIDPSPIESIKFVKSRLA